ERLHGMQEVTSSNLVFSTKGGMSDRLQTNVCSFFVSGQKRGFMRRCRPETKETAFAAIGHFRFFVRMPAAAKRSDEHREANSAYLSESLSRAAKTSLRSSQSFPPHKRHSHKNTSCGAKID
ncbi:hypothetical protein, partial [uncultured Alistipes sp.]|uniref:hypothetical protein n=1 Tax=uncultured Alistipes sp. TaxID=538949 RepID=UPI00273466CC